MTRRLSTTVPASLTVAVATVLALGLFGPASTKAVAEPTLTVTRDCESYGDVGADSINARLTGFPAFTPFDLTLEVSNGLGVGPVHGTTDANGNAEPREIKSGEHTHEIWAVMVVWAGGTLTQSLYVDCTSPDGAVTVIPPDQYINGCGSPPAFPAKALQGHEGDDTIDGTYHFDLLGGGGGDDSLSGEGLADCLFGQRGADVIRGQEGKDSILGQRGADELMGQQGGDQIRGGRGRDTMSGGEGDDHIRDAANRNRISCGKGIDRVKTNGKSKVTESCERVTRR